MKLKSINNVIRRLSSWSSVHAYFWFVLWELRWQFYVEQLSIFLGNWKPRRRRQTSTHNRLKNKYRLWTRNSRDCKLYQNPPTALLETSCTSTREHPSIFSVSNLLIFCSASDIWWSPPQHAEWRRRAEVMRVDRRLVASRSIWENKTFLDFYENLEHDWG